MKYKFGIIKEEKKPLSYYIDKDHPLYEDLLSLMRMASMSNEYIREARANTEYVVNDLTGNLIKTGRINLVGYPLRWDEDIINLARILGNKKFETNRILYVKDDKIVGQDAVTIDLPHQTFAHYAPNNKMAFIQIKQKIDRLGADGYYIVHNHPSGDSTPSQKDKNLCIIYSQNIPGFLGGIVLGKDNFSIISIDKNLNVKTEFKGDYNDNREKLNDKGPIINYVEKNNWDLSSDTFVIYVDTSLRLISVQRIANKEFNDKNIFRYIANEKHSNGALRCFVVTSSEDIYWACATYINNKSQLITDVFYFNGNSYKSAVYEHDYLPSTIIRDSKTDIPKMRKQKL